jgi:DNA-binding PadR family transcriptional regulator
MADSPMNFNVSDAINGLRGLVSSVRTNSNQMKPSSRDPREMRVAVLSVLKSDSKNGKEVIQAIELASLGAWTPKSSEIYPLLEEMTDEGLISIKIQKELRVYSLSKSGKAFLAEAIDKMKEKKSESAKSAGSNWLEMNASTLRSGAKLAQALAQVAQNGTAEQQKLAAELVDETRRKVYAILSEK